MATAFPENTPDAYNQVVWHVPTTGQKLTTLQWIELVAKELNVAPKVQPVSKGMLRLLGLFVPVMREFPETLYQFDQDYVLDSTKFEKRFEITPTPPEAGIKALIEILR